MSAVAEKQNHALAENTVSMFERLACDPNVDVEKLERLMQMQERAMARVSEEAYSRDMAKMQPELPVIRERGNAAGRYTYALWEDINLAIKPVLARHGFALTFLTDFANGITVTAVLRHREGHSERTSMVLAPDKSGNKNDVQAVASAVSYGKRYTAGALLNLTSHGEDDDAFRVASDTITEDQEATLDALLSDVGADKAKFLKWAKVESLSEIHKNAYAASVEMIEAKRRAK